MKEKFYDVGAKKSVMIDMKDVKHETSKGGRKMLVAMHMGRKLYKFAPKK
jgi:hypothetical protein